jgi:hypothetical protein
MHLLVPIRSTRNMNYPYSSFFMDLRLAKKQLKQALAPGPGVFVEDPPPPQSAGRRFCAPVSVRPRPIRICQNSCHISMR